MTEIWMYLKMQVREYSKHEMVKKLNYCKTLIIRVTLFSRCHQPRFIHETLFSRFVISSYIILIVEIIGEDFIFASLCSREWIYAKNKVLTKNKCFTVIIEYGQDTYNLLPLLFGF